MNPIQAVVERPYTVAVAVILAVLFGVLALLTIPVQLKPNVVTPQIGIATTFRGASAVEVEEQLTRELEEVLQSVEGLTEMVSTSSEGVSNINLEFSYGTNTQLAVVDVINKLSQASRLPPEADEPVVTIDASLGRDTVMWIVVGSGQDPNTVRRIVEEDIKARLERLPGVASVFVAGGADREVQVRIDPDELVARGLSIRKILSALTRGNVNVRGGTVETPGRQLVVRTVGRAEDIEQLGRLIVKETPAGSVRLAEVATILDTHREMAGFVNINGVDGVALGVNRRGDANVLDLVDELIATLHRINSQYAARGIDIHLWPTYQETDYIRQALSFVTDNLVLGSILAIIVLLLFLRSARSVLIVAVSIPISLVTVFLIVEALGRTLNVITLAGIAFASGMVVDNAIVVLENIFRHMEQGRSARAAAIAGGREVWGGVLASTLTTIAVFVPILLQSDEASALFADMALAISCAVALSLVVALTVVPVLASLLYRRKAPANLRRSASTRADAGPAERAGPDPTSSSGPSPTTGDTLPALTSAAAVSAGLGFVGRLYSRFTDALCRPSPGATAGKAGFALLILAMALVSLQLTPPAEYLPTGNRNLEFFFADPIPGTRPEAVRENFKAFEQFALAQPETDRMFAVGGRFFNGGGIVLKNEFADGPTLAAFHQRLFGPAADLPGFRFVVPVRSSLFEDPGKQFEIELSGPDLKGLEAASKLLEDRLGGVPGIDFVRNSLVLGRPELTVSIDENRAKDLGLDAAAVGEVVSTVVAGRRVSALIDAGREVEVNVVAPQARVSTPAELAALNFIVPDGRVINLGSVASVEQTVGPQTIRRLERERNVLLTVNIAADAALERVVSQVEDEIFPSISADLGPAYTLAMGGSADKLKQTLQSLSGGFGFSVLIIYLLLVSLFRSWFTPVVILVTVPLALSGGLLGIRVAHELSGGQAAFDVIAMLGFVILAGLVVNNAILIVHQANNFRAEGHDRRAALALSARSRLRPILMAALTTISAMIPLAMGGGAGAELYQGLGAVIVGGLTLSTAFTLLLVPVLLSLGHDLLDWIGGWRGPRAAPVSS